MHFSFNQPNNLHYYCHRLLSSEYTNTDFVALAILNDDEVILVLLLCCCWSFGMPCRVQAPRKMTASNVVAGDGLHVDHTGWVVTAPSSVRSCFVLQNGGYVVPHPHVLGRTATRYRVPWGPVPRSVVWSKQSAPREGGREIRKSS